jgi:hypothetical protein
MNKKSDKHSLKNYKHETELRKKKNSMKKLPIIKKPLKKKKNKTGGKKTRKENHNLRKTKNEKGMENNSENQSKKKISRKMFIHTTSFLLFSFLFLLHLNKPYLLPLLPRFRLSSFFL